MSQRPRVVALGGGHGLAATLSAARQLTDRLTAVVTVADDGGSSGRLRSAYGLLPPGDLRMALAALAGDDEHSLLLRGALQHRFAGGELGGHPVGNVLLAGLLQHLGNPVAALGAVERLLGLRPDTHVLPMSCEPLDIVAEVAGVATPAGTDTGRAVTVRGQVAVAGTRGRVVAIRLLPVDPPACPEALAAVAAADALILGPGSLFTSVLPHLLLPDLRKAVTAAQGLRVLVMNLVPQAGETDGFSAEAHLEVLAAHAPGLTLDVVIADRRAATANRGQMQGGLRAAAEELGARVVLAQLGRPDQPGAHDPVALAAVLGEVLVSGRGAMSAVTPAGQMPAGADGSYVGRATR